MTLEQLIEKYNVTGPRYTSYPTALLMQPIHDPASWMLKLAEDRRNDTNISVYIHLPFCRSLCWYCGCNKIITRKSEDADIYLDYLEKDFALSAATLPSNHRVTQLHLGGGTPTFLSPSQLLRLSLLLHRHLNVAPDAECSVEMDPRNLTRAHVQVLRNMGFNRASIGVQDIDPQVQQAIHRIQPLEMNRQVVEWLREKGFESVNMDLIYGLPAQTPERFGKTVEEILKLRPDRLAIYNYAHMPERFPSQRLIPNDLLPGESDRLKMFGDTARTLIQEGYVHIGMDHFALPEDELSLSVTNGTLRRNFQGYSTQAGTNTIAFGISAISQTNRIMIQRHKSLKDYYKSLDNNELPFEKGFELDFSDRLRRDVIMQIMCGLQIDWDFIDRVYGVNSRLYFEDEIDQLMTMQEDGLISCDYNGFRVTSKGRYFVRNIAMAFDSYLGEKQQRYSKTV